MTRRIVDLPAPLVPSSASTSPLRTSKPTSKRICTWPYEKSTWLTWSAATWSGSALRRSMLVLLLAELGDDHRQVVVDERGATQDQQGPADDRRRHVQHDDRHPGAVGVREQTGQQRATGRADEEDVERTERLSHPAQPVGDHRGQQRPDHRERDDRHHRGGHGQDGEPHRVRHEVLHRHQQRRRQHEPADETQRLGRILAVLPVVELADERHREHHGDAARRC